MTTYAPKQYFDFFQLPRVQVRVVETPEDENRCHAIDVLQRLEDIEHEEEVLRGRHDFMM